MITWNVVWPAIYVTEEIQSFWFLVFITIAIEALSLMALAKFRAEGYYHCKCWQCGIRHDRHFCDDVVVTFLASGC